YLHCLCFLILFIDTLPAIPFECRNYTGHFFFAVEVETGLSNSDEFPAIAAQIALTSKVCVNFCRAMPVVTIAFDCDTLPATLGNEVDKLPCSLKLRVHPEPSLRQVVEDLLLEARIEVVDNDVFAHSLQLEELRAVRALFLLKRIGKQLEAQVFG